MIKRTETYRSDENGFLDDADVAGFLKRSHRRERYLAERDTAKGTFLTDRIDGVRKERETDLSEILAGRWEKTEIRKVLYESLKELADSIADIDNLLNDFNREIAGYLEDFTFSDEEYYETEKRLDLLNDLKAKYGRTLEDVQAYLDAQKNKLQEMENFDERKEELAQHLAKAETDLRSSCKKLTEARKKAAADLSAQIRTSLQDLNFLSSAFDIDFSDTEHYSAKGTDAVCFMISTNPGEPMRPLSKVVSGGELSRIMLAIKTILADRDATETLIFDEIDTGISGRTAQAVSEKMARIASTPLMQAADSSNAEEQITGNSSSAEGHLTANDIDAEMLTENEEESTADRQVICITHLAQIAAMADHHFLIEKNVENGATVSHIRELDDEESVEELARILGGARITPAVLENAREMKKLARDTRAGMQQASNR